MKNIYSFILYISIFLVIQLSLNTDNCFSQWQYQPISASGTPYDMKFFDTNTGIISFNSPGLYRTTNGGINWNIILPNQIAFLFDKIDMNTVYAAASTSNAYGMLLRTFNKGLTWDSFQVGNSWTANGLSFINKDTGWICGTSGGNHYIWKTINSGVNFTVQKTGIGFGYINF